MNAETDVESQRILTEFSRREREVGRDFYGLHRPANLFIRQSQQRSLLRQLSSHKWLPLSGKKLLDVGCGSGDGLLTTFEEFGILRNDIAGIELVHERAEACLTRFAGADIRIGNANHLPWKDGTFDIVLQATMFTSILDRELKHQIAQEMLRVLKHNGCIVWYDFFRDNPSNKQVKGIRLTELQELFPGTLLSYERITLAPPLARKIVPFSWSFAGMLEQLTLLNTHFMAVLFRANGTQ